MDDIFYMYTKNFFSHTYSVSPNILNCGIGLIIKVWKKRETPVIVQQIYIDSAFGVQPLRQEKRVSSILVQ